MAGKNWFGNTGSEKLFQKKCPGNVTPENEMLSQWDCVGEGGTFFMEGNLILVTKCELICRTSVDVVL